VGAFSLARRVLQHRWAFIAAAFIAVQATFAQNLPALARQEIAIVFYIGMVGAMFDERLPWRQRWALTGIFGVGMAVSHYSTTYFSIEMLILLLLTQWGVSWFRNIPKVTGAVALALGVTVITAIIWYGPLTRSGSNVTQVAHTLTSQGADVLPTQGQNPVSTYLYGTTQAAMTPAQYQSMVAQYYATQVKYVVPLADATDPQYALQPSTVPTPPVRVKSASSLTSIIELLAEQLGEFLAVVGTAFLVLRRSTPVQARQVALLSVGILVALFSLKFSGSLSEVYNPDRAFLQAYGVLAIPMAWSLQYIAVRVKHRAWIIVVPALGALVIMFAGMSGLANVAFGGGVATNLSNSGGDAEHYDTTAAEVAAARWLGQQVQPGQLVYADRYGALRLNAETSISNGLLTDVTPQTIDQNAWIYATTVNVVDGHAAATFENHTVTYAFPAGFLNSNFSVLYTNGSSEVYKR
jgi:uncharacterized membrane protein